MLVGKPMLNNMFQPACNGGDVCRISCLASAVHSAPHWTIDEQSAYLEPNSNTMQKPVRGLSAALLRRTIYSFYITGAKVFSEQLFSSLARFKCENLK